MTTLTQIVDGLQTELVNKASRATLTQAVDSLQTQLNDKVDKKEVISAINLSNEGTHITADRIYLDGSV